MPAPQTPPLIERFKARLRDGGDRHATLVKAMSFAAVGALNALVDLGVFSLAFYVAELPLVAANVAAWMVAVTGSYVMNSMTTFAHESGRQLNLRRYGFFAASQVGGLFANTATVLAASYVMPVLVGKVLAIGVSFVVNFSLSHFLVFRKHAGEIGPTNDR